MTRKKPALPAVQPTRPNPGKRVTARAAEAQARLDARPERLEVDVANVADMVSRLEAPHTDVQAWRATLLDSFGSSSQPFVDREVALIAESQREKNDVQTNAGKLNAALAAIDGTRPENEMAAMLASQMTACHALAMDFVGRSRRADYIEGALAYAGSAVKLMRTFAAQTETLARIKRGGEQTVRVEHVHVHPGANAIVGSSITTNQGGGVATKNEEQAHEAIDARALAFAPGAEMWGPDEGRDAVPESRGDGQDPLQATRGRAG